MSEITDERAAPVARTRLRSAPREEIVRQFADGAPVDVPAVGERARYGHLNLWIEGANREEAIKIVGAEQGYRLLAALLHGVHERCLKPYLHAA